MRLRRALRRTITVYDGTGGQSYAPGWEIPEDAIDDLARQISAKRREYPTWAEFEAWARWVRGEEPQSVSVTEASYREVLVGHVERWDARRLGPPPEDVDAVGTMLERFVARKEVA